MFNFFIVMDVSQHIEKSCILWHCLRFVIEKQKIGHNKQIRIDIFFTVTDKQFIVSHTYRCICRYSTRYLFMHLTSSLVLEL